MRSTPPHVASTPSHIAGRLGGGGVLANWTEVSTEAEVDFDEWHVREHIPQRLMLPGFHRVRRYRSVADTGEGHVQHMTIYETETVDTLASDGYLADLDNPTEWSQRVIPLIAGGKRAACRVAVSNGHAIGGFAASLDFVLDAADAGSAFSGWLNEVLDRPQITGAHVLEAVDEITFLKARTAESRYTAPRQTLEWCVVLDGLSLAAVSHAIHEVQSQLTSRAVGTPVETSLGIYQLVCVAVPTPDGEDKAHVE